MLRNFKVTFYLRKLLVFNLIYCEFLRRLRLSEQLSAETFCSVLRPYNVHV